MQSIGTDAQFVYNENGLRGKKTVNEVVTDYILHGKNIVHMKRGDDELHFFYDAQNRPAVVVYNGTAYAYVKSLQGDIVAILDENGNTVVSYGYDAWGMPLWCTGELAETLGKVQPFRYRGYVFDEESGLYYLRSRYYNPRWGRFVNADMLIQCKKIGCNLFAYCSNRPILFADANGTEEYPDVYEVILRSASVRLEDAENNLLCYLNRSIELYTTQKDIEGKIYVYFLDETGQMRDGYIPENTGIIWYGCSPEHMDMYINNYFKTFFEDGNFLRKDNSNLRKNAALEVMLHKFLDGRDSKDTTQIYVDGIYGTDNEWAVREFQDHVQIKVDGIAGKETIDALRDYFIAIYRHYVPE